MVSRPVSVNDILDGHVGLDLECLDRIYLNGYVPNLQVGGQIVQFLALRGFPIPSPVVVDRIGDRCAGRCARSPTPTRSRWSSSPRVSGRWCLAPGSVALGTCGGAGWTRR